MPEFLFEFTDTTRQDVRTTIEADDQDAAQEKFDSGDWRVHVTHEDVIDRSAILITKLEDECSTADSL